jgi:hypothetical protein
MHRFLRSSRVSRHYNLLILVLAAGGCGSIDKFLEGNQPSDARLRVALQSSAVSVEQGSEQTLVVTVTRVGEYSGPVAISVEGVPFGVTAEVGGASTTGAETSAPVTLRVGASAAPGSYTLLVRSHADPIPVDGTAPLGLTVTQPPAYALALSLPGLVIARGGVAPVTVQLSRTNYSAPVTLSLTGTPGITASFGTNPVSGSSAPMTVAVAAGVAPGNYDMILRGVGAGLADRSTSFPVTVTADPLQLVMGPGLSVPQGSVVNSDIILNRAGFAGPVTLTTENLPTGVTASFNPASPTATSAVMTLFIQPTVVPSTYGVRVRGSGGGVPDATVDFNLVVNPSGLSLVLNPEAVSLFQGTSTTSALTLARNNLDGGVALSVEGTPPGVTVQLDQASISGSSATLAIGSDPDATPGVYPVTIRAVPASWPPGASRTAVLTVTVRAAPTGGGNVLLDWSGCALPNWVGVQDGNGSWVQKIPSAGVVSFSLTADKGGIAFVESGNAVVVRFHTRAELTAGTLNMCPPVQIPGSRTITGLAVHNGAGEVFAYSLGGAIASSSQASPNFSLVGVRDGVHDLVGWGTTAGAFGLRGFLRRDIDLPDGGALDPVDFLGVGSFAPQRNTLSVLLNQNDQVSHSMSYLTTALCTANPLYSNVLGTTSQMSGVPAPLQRAEDLHLVTVTASGFRRTRVATLAFQLMSGRSLVLPPLLTVPTVSTLPAGYKALQAVLASMPVVYNGTVNFRYTAGTKAMSISASMSYFGTGAVVLAMPNFGAVPGWPNAAAIGTGESGTWNYSVDGSSGPKALCTVLGTTVFNNQQGNF